MQPSRITLERKRGRELRGYPCSDIISHHLREKEEEEEEEEEEGLYLRIETRKRVMISHPLKEKERERDGRLSVQRYTLASPRQLSRIP